MGWSRGRNSEGREIGYSIESTCEEPGCVAPINLGLAYCCGELRGVEGDYGCGHYYCPSHLYYGAPVQLCGPCLAKEPVCETCGERRASHDYACWPCWREWYSGGSVVDEEER